MEPDWYHVLGVEPTDNYLVIKAAFRKKARETHPDTTQDDHAEAFFQVRKAGDVLLDANRRQAYDQRRKLSGQTRTPYPKTADAWASLLQKTVQDMAAQSWQSQNQDWNYAWLSDHGHALMANMRAQAGASNYLTLLPLLLSFLPHLNPQDQAYFLATWDQAFVGPIEKNLIRTWHKKLYWQGIWTKYQLLWVLLLTTLIVLGLSLL